MYRIIKSLKKKDYKEFASTKSAIRDLIGW